MKVHLKHLWRLAFTMNGSLCEIKNWKRFRDMILSLSDNQGSKKEVFFRTFSQKLSHSVMLLKCLHLTTTSLWKPTTYYCYISTPRSLTPEQLPSQKEGSLPTMQFSGAMLLVFGGGEGVDTMVAFCFLLFGNTPFISSMATPKAKYPDVQRCWSLCTKAPESGNLRNIQAFETTLMDYIIISYKKILHWYRALSNNIRIFVVLVLGVLPPNLLETELCLTHLAHFGLEKPIVFLPGWPVDAAARRVFRMKWINTFGKLSRKTDGLSDVEMLVAFHGSKIHQLPSFIQFHDMCFVFEMHSYIIFLFVVSCCWFCCSEKQCHEWVRNWTKIGWPFFTCWETSTSPCHACTITVDGSEMPRPTTSDV